MKKKMLILSLSVSFFTFISPLVDAQAPPPWRLSKDFLGMVKKLESTPSINGLEASDYKKVHLWTEIEGSDGDKIGLTEERLKTKSELRLRQAGLEPIPSTAPWGDRLEITVLVASKAFHIEMRFFRDALFEAKGKSYYAKPQLGEQV